jgi:hypothetical protein
MSYEIFRSFVQVLEQHYIVYVCVACRVVAWPDGTSKGTDAMPASDNPATALQVLENLARVGRFDMIVMFLANSEKQCMSLSIWRTHSIHCLCYRQ